MAPTGYDWTPAPARRRRPSVFALVLIAVTLVAVTAGVAGVFVARAQESSSFTLHGTMTIPSSDAPDQAGAACIPQDGYTDVPGAQVVVTDQHGTVVATGSLPAQGTVGGGDQAPCVFVFTVSVPGGHPYYGVQVAHRGSLTYPAAKLENGTLALEVGMDSTD